MDKNINTKNIYSYRNYIIKKLIIRYNKKILINNISNNLENLNIF